MRMLKVLVTTVVLATAWQTVEIKAADGGFPNKSIQLILPVSAGGGLDISMRMLASIAEQKLGQRVLVVNKPGGGAAIGMREIVHAKPDGYTIGGVWNAPITMIPHIHAAEYTLASYTTVAMVATSGIVFCTKRDFPAKTAAQFVDELKSKPNRYTYGTEGVGGLVHLTAERIFQNKDIKVRAVPFTSAGEQINAFLSNSIDIYGGTVPPIMPYLENGTVKCQLASSAKRSPQLPDVEALEDIGIAELSIVNWRGIIAPVGVPPEHLAVLEQAFLGAADSEKFRKFLAARSEEAQNVSGPGFRKLVAEEYAAMGNLVKGLGLTK